MSNNLKPKITGIVFILFALASCSIPDNEIKTENNFTPESFSNEFKDTTSIANLNWKNYFDDNNLSVLIDSALQNNQEMNIMKQEIEISKNEILTRRGEYLPCLLYTSPSPRD